MQTQIEQDALAVLHHKALAKSRRYLNKLYSRVTESIVEAEVRAHAGPQSIFDSYETMVAHLDLQEQASVMASETISRRPQVIGADTMYFCYESPDQDAFIPLYYHFDCSEVRTFRFNVTFDNNIIIRFCYHQINKFQLKAGRALNFEFS